jgi:YD repeat-containing protein
MAGNGLGHAATYRYDALNRQTLLTDPLGHKTTTTFDVAGRMSTMEGCRYVRNELPGVTWRFAKNRTLRPGRWNASYAAAVLSLPGIRNGRNVPFFMPASSLQT